MKLLAALAGALALATTAQAATYDAFTSFNGTQGAGGFTYLQLPAGPGQMAVVLTAPSGACVVTSDYCLQLGGSLPGAYKSLTTFSEGSYTVPNDRLLVHPGPSNPIAIFFTAPTAGDYDYIFSVNVLDRSPSGVQIATVTNNSGMAVGTPVGLLTSGAPSITRSGTIALDAGQVFAIVVSPFGNYANDSTGVNFTLTSASAPEPASWALMIAGFGVAGGLLRRRARIAV